MSVEAGMRVFEKRSRFKTSLSAMIAFHEDPRVFGYLVPPGVIMRMHDDQRTSLTQGDLTFTLWMGVVPLKWHARHEPGPTANSFADVMISGPLQYWRHEHIFNPVEQGVELIDRVTYRYKPGAAGWFSRVAFSTPALHFLFFYRHLRTRFALEGKNGA